MKKNKQRSSVVESSVFMDTNGDSSTKPTSASNFGESRVSLNGVDVSREYSVFQEASQPSPAMTILMKEIFDN